MINKETIRRIANKYNAKVGFRKTSDSELQATLSFGFRRTLIQYGWHITFKNKYVISVQIGNGNYCENRDVSYQSILDFGKCPNAEIAVIDRDGELLELDHPSWGSDTVMGFVDEEMLEEICDFVNSFEGPYQRLEAIEEL